MRTRTLDLLGNFKTEKQSIECRACGKALELELQPHLPEPCVRLWWRAQPVQLSDGHRLYNYLWCKLFKVINISLCRCV